MEWGLLVNEEFLAKLDKKTRDRIIMANEVSNLKVPTASVGLTKALGGGFGAGRATMVYGNKSSGKSSSMLQMIAINQKQGKICAWVDAENSFDKEWAIRLGVDIDSLILSEAKSIHEMTAVVCGLLKAEIDICVVDSISALIPSTYFEDKKDEMAEGLDKTKQIGSFSKEMAIFYNKANYLNKRTSLVMISQVRNKFNQYGASLKPMGGEAAMFFSSTVIKLWSSASEKEQKTREVMIGDKLVAIPVGRKVTYTVEFNKIGPPNQIGEYDFYYDGSEVGIDQIGELVDQCEKYGYITRGSTGWYTLEVEEEIVKLQGRDKVVALVKKNGNLKDSLLARFNV